ncbi:MAG: NAD(P)-binding protein, partial [Albidovulum sp.]|uniref:NAD(P)-binding protein n=1 Tax=Albidovulum sp. TaxID=1872424 RepID=UPI003C9921D8
MSWDAVVIGAGHNGLIAAARLGAAGKKVLVLEAREAAGGLLSGAVPVAHLPTGLSPAVVKGLGLERHGLRPRRPLTTVALGAGEPVRIIGGVVTGVDAGTAVAYAGLHARLVRQAGALAPLMAKTPPRLRDGGMGELMTLAGLGLSIRWLGKADMQDLLRIILSNIWDVLSDEIGDGPLAGALAMDATLGGAMGPRSPGTVLPLLYRLAGQPRMRFKGGT